MVTNSQVVYDLSDEGVITHHHQLTNDRGKSVVLTFDDGPGKYLPQILDVLKQEQVSAMFFWQTRLLYPERPWKRLIEEGHMIGSHTCKHPDLRKLDYDQQYREIQMSIQKIEKITGQQVRYFRPPFGQYTNCTLVALKKLNVIPVMWSAASFDWELKNQAEQIVTNVISHLEDGAIILLHELAQTVSALPLLIQQIRQRGYTFTLLPKEPDNIE